MSAAASRAWKNFMPWKHPKSCRVAEKQFAILGFHPIFPTMSEIFHGWAAKEQGGKLEKIEFDPGEMRPE